VRKLFHFVLGLITSGIYVFGIVTAGFLYYDHLLNLPSVQSVTLVNLLPLLVLGIISFIPLLIVVFLYCPKFLKLGAIMPCAVAIGIAGYGISNKTVTPFLTDDVAYRSCVGNFEHAKGIADCTALIGKLENSGEIKLKDIDNTQGDYWLAEMLSYRGRHYIRHDQLQFGKEDFARAFLLPEGGAVVAGNLAEVGLVRQELFQPDYEKELSKLLELIKEENVSSLTEASNFLKAQLATAIEKCRLTTGREGDDCRQIIIDGIF